MNLILRIGVGVLLLFALSSSALAQDSAAGAAKPSKYLKTKYDKSKDQTTVTLKKISLSGSMAREVGNANDVPQLSMDASFNYPGQQLTKPVEEVTLKFSTFSKYPAYQKSQNVVGVVDGDNALVLGASTYSSNSQTFGIEEILSIKVPYAALKRIADSKTFKLYLGSREIDFKETEHAALRDLAGAMAP